jgi:CheY-like chemotaxis protein
VIGTVVLPVVMMGRLVRELVRTLSLVRVLLAEDFEPFRRFIHTTLQTELQSIAEVSDGLEAVSKAEELQPDLILLDIGLPTLNGIEAARQIHLLSPQSKILFVSQESSADVIEEAMNSGALGYVVKAHMPRPTCSMPWKRFVRVGSLSAVMVCQVTLRSRKLLTLT